VRRRLVVRVSHLFVYLHRVCSGWLVFCSLVVVAVVFFLLVRMMVFLLVFVFDDWSVVCIGVVLFFGDMWLSFFVCGGVLF
jgi:hypothetical protein